MRKFYVYYKRTIYNPIHTSEHTNIITIEGKVDPHVIVEKLQEMWESSEAEFIPLAWSLIE